MIFQLLIESCLIVLLFNTSLVTENVRIPAAIHSRHSINYKYYDIPVQPTKPHLIVVDSSSPSFLIRFRSASSPIKVFQKHESSKAPDVQRTTSADEPHILKHKINKPIIQMVREIIIPYRRIVQDIRPVVETIKTVVSTSNGAPLDLGREANMQNRRKAVLEMDNDINDIWSSLIDNSLYNGNSVYDLKYVSPNQHLKMFSNNHNNSITDSALNYMLRLYKDR